MAQALHSSAQDQQQDQQPQRWLSLELRHDRVYRTFTRAALLHCPSLVVLGGDATVIVPSFLPPASLSAAFVNYPEPPQQNGADGGDSQGKHLLTAGFMRDVAGALKEGGLFTILTDNIW